MLLVSQILLSGQASVGPEWLRRLGNTHCSTYSIPSLSPTNAYMRTWIKRLGCNAGNQEVSRCCTKKWIWGIHCTPAMKHVSDEYIQDLNHRESSKNYKETSVRETDEAQSLILRHEPMPGWKRYVKRFWNKKFMCFPMPRGTNLWLLIPEKLWYLWYLTVWRLLWNSYGLGEPTFYQTSLIISISSIPRKVVC